ncbi:SET domain-containing protein-lysine N-methyltransferase [archaeon]|jgi:SET domain-containing protein|nr:SET domain-containing protein-lysine N-methyltransferase [archaeon]MBT3451609.1 SET domain-containing protein-lysine N-methyltransferase [archaeon]MBT6869629.1 SET domain-containing protein-lysine N-methyltransferase [archaeon]MBT7192398.1 SET domain-containing protein-lysine N-methyltransferase [archaeon]MBT7380199.1 SET domain-containing protein-lysine N-methyltransferase [archaeon]
MNIIIKESHISGKGIFAGKDFKKGEVVMVWDFSYKIKRNEIKNLSLEDQNHLNYIGKGNYVIMKSPEKYVNHSCHTNTYVDNEKDIALRDINKGEEITTDYSVNSMEDWEMPCSCGSKNCRKVIVGDFRKLDVKVRKKLEPYLQDWFKKEIE